MDEIFDNDFVKKVAKEIYENNSDYKLLFSLSDIIDILDLSKKYQNTNEEKLITGITDKIENKIEEAVFNLLESDHK